MSELTGQEVERSEVSREFDRRAEEVSGINSVLDASDEAGVRLSNLYRDRLGKFLVKRFLRPSKRDVILDYGCGIGRLSEYLAPDCKEIHGVDVSEKMILRARNEDGASNVQYHYAKDGHTHLPSAIMDKAFTYWVLAHNSDEDALDSLAEMKRLMKTGARACLFEHVRSERLEVSPIYVQRDEQSMKSLIENAGFTLIKVKFVARHPSYGLYAWKKMHWLGNAVLGILPHLELATVQRKAEMADYHMALFIIQKT